MELEIRSSYFLSNDDSIASSISDQHLKQSDQIFSCIQMNRAKDLLELLKSVPTGQLYNLVNMRHLKYENMLPLNYAIRCSANYVIIIMLLRVGARCTNNHESSLMMAVRSGQYNLVKLFILSGLDVNALDRDGYSILHWACFKKNPLLVRLIVNLKNFTFHNHDRNKKRISPLGNIYHCLHYIYINFLSLFFQYSSTKTMYV